jgi:hypothetical protein
MFPKEKLVGDSPKEESFYSKSKREKLVEEGALNSEEDGFMQGYEEDSYEFDDEEYDKFESTSGGIF